MGFEPLGVGRRVQAGADVTALLVNSSSGSRPWNDGTFRKLEVFCKSCRCTAAERGELLVRWRAQYKVDREAYLATLPEISRTGRLIWLHARRHGTGAAPW